jgi:hypothetical protein
MFEKKLCKLNYVLFIFMYIFAGFSEQMIKILQCTASLIQNHKQNFLYDYQKWLHPQIGNFYRKVTTKYFCTYIYTIYCI